MKRECQKVPKHESVSHECLSYIRQVYRVLSSLEDTKGKLFSEFNNDNEAMKGLMCTFRDIEPLKSTYEIILDSVKHAESNTRKKFYLYDVFLDPIVSNYLKLYKPFLNQYLDNAKWIGDFYRINDRCKLICDKFTESHEVTENINLINGLYTVFNSLFCLELMFNRYKSCFAETSEQFRKSDEAMTMISKILMDVNKNNNQQDFQVALNELNLLTNITLESKINVRFIYKGCAMKFARRNNKPLRRQLVLFSDCLYVTLLPGIIRGTSDVKQELSVESMKVTEFNKEDSLSISLPTWGLNIKCREAVQDFFFDSEEIMKIWKDKLLLVIKQGNKDTIDLYSKTDNDLTTLGFESPKWQKDNAASICNGYNCDQRFSTIIRRHHCRADGLLYCEICSSYKLRLNFDPSVESRVCELCYNILHLSLNDQKSIQISLNQLREVKSRKTRSGTKMGWLLVKLFDCEKKLFLLEVKNYCELKSDAPILNFYEKPEDKCYCRSLKLLEMTVSRESCCNYAKKLSSKEFILLNITNDQLYHMTATNEEDCKLWIISLEDAINDYLQKNARPLEYLESDEEFESDKDCYFIVEDK